jgi:hypothetical protein
MEQITSSYNLFVDTSTGHNSQSKGDDYMVNLQDAGVHAGEGEHIRMSLSNFSMAKNFTDVNDTNNEFILGMQNSNAAHNIDEKVKLDNRNYTSVTDLATNFADKIGAQMLAAGQGFTLNAHTGMETITNDNIITFTINTTAAHNYTSGLILFNSDISDSYALLGGNRWKTADPITPQGSVTVTIPSITSVKVTCHYPAQRSTMPFVYIRAPGVLNTNIETQGLRNPNDNHNSDVAHSNILGRAVVESQEWIQFTAQSERDFFIDIHQKQLNVLRLQLTDSKNRLIGRRDHSNTATGTGTEQSTLGNLSFSAVLRFDIIKRKSVHHLETEHYQPPIPARFSEGNVPIKIR